MSEKLKSDGGVDQALEDICRPQLTSTTFGPFLNMHEPK